MIVALLLAACGPSAGSSPEQGLATVWNAGPPLPSPVTNNAVAAVEVGGTVAVFSLLGLDSTKLWSGVTNVAYRWDVGSDLWRTIDPVPGPGRLASTAQVVGGLIYLIGGYTVAQDGAERSVPNVDVYDPVTDRWSRAADIPIPTDDAVSGVWSDSLIVLVSGWHDTGNVSDVQIFDPATNQWSASTSIPSAPVFGHAGGVAGNTVVYTGGAAVVDGNPRYALAQGVWAGALDAGEIEWDEVESHAGPALYRAAGGSVGGLLVLLGGTDNPYNYHGIGYDGVPADPLHQLLAYSSLTGDWSQLAPPPVASMDHRNVGVAGGTVFLVGGMHADQVVTDKVWYASTEMLLGTGG